MANTSRWLLSGRMRWVVSSQGEWWSGSITSPWPRNREKEVMQPPRIQNSTAQSMRTLVFVWSCVCVSGFVCMGAMQLIPFAIRMGNCFPWEQGNVIAAGVLTLIADLVISIGSWIVVAVPATIVWMMFKR